MLVDTDFLSKKSSDITIHAEEIKRNINKISDEVMSIGTHWRDRNYINFAKRTDDFVKELQSINLQTIALNDILKDYIRKYERVEDEGRTYINLE